MAKQPVKATIDGLVFEFFPLPPRTAIKIMARLTKLIGEPIGALGDAAFSGAKGAEKGKILAQILSANLDDGLAKAMRSLSDRLDEDEVYQTIELMIEGVQGKMPGDQGTRPLNVDVDFEGEIGLLFKVIGKYLEVNFKSFFQGIKTGAQVLRSRPMTDSIPVS